jgi:ankyrin repeat protein
MHTTALPDNAMLLNLLKSITTEEVTPVAVKQNIINLYPQLAKLIPKKLHLFIASFIPNIKLAKELYDPAPTPVESLLGLGLIKKKPLPETSDGHSSYKLLRTVIKQAQTIKNSFNEEQKNKLEIQELISCLDKLIDHYQIFIAKLQQAPNKETRVAILNTDQAELRCLGLPCSYLTPQARDEIMKLDAKTGTLERPKDEIGAHIVHRHGGLHFKFLANNELKDDDVPAELDADDDPGMAYAIKKLFQLIYPNFDMIPATALTQIHHKGKHYPIQVSITISGKTFQEWAEEENDLSRLNSKSFSAWIIFSILIKTRDAKTNNFIVIDDPHTPNEKVLVGIDNDDALGPEWLLSSRSSQEHIPGVKNFLFCMEQMQQPIDPSISKEFCQLDPAIIISRWLLDLLEQNEYYEKLVKEQILTPVIMEKLNLPFKLTRGTALRLYQDFKKIQDLLSNTEHNARLTHQALLNAAQPLIGIYYENVLKKHEGIPPLDTFLKNIYKFSEAIEPLLADRLQENEKKQLAACQTLNSEYSAEVRDQHILTALIEFTASLDWQNINITSQHILLNLLLNSSHISHFNFKNCHAIDDNHLVQFMGLLKKLHKTFHFKHLLLENCSQVTANSLYQLCENFPDLKLILHNMPWSHANWQHLLATYSDRVSIILPSGHFYNLNLTKNDILHQAIFAQQTELLFACLALGLSANKSAQDGDTPLHVAVRLDNIQMVEHLLNAGAMGNAQNKQKLTALDIAVSSRSMLMVVMLIKHEVWHYTGKTSVKDIINLYLSAVPHPLDESNFIPLFNFLKHSNQFDETTINWIPSTIQYLNLKDSNVTDEGLQQICRQCPHLRKIDLCGCNLVSLNGLEILAQTGLTEIDVNFEQMEQWGLISLDNLINAYKLTFKRIRFNIIEFDLGNRTFTDSQQEDLCAAIGLCAHLRILNLNNVTFTFQQWHQLFFSLLYLRNLAPPTPPLQLLLRGCQLNNGIIQELYTLIQKVKNPVFDVLDLSENNLTTESAKHLNAILEKSSIRNLQLYNNNLGSGVTLLIENLAENAHLKILDLNQTNMGNKEAAALAMQLKKNKTLTDIDIGYNPLTDEGINALHSALYQHLACRPPQIRAGGLSLSNDTVYSLQNSRLGQFLFIGEHKISPQQTFTIEQITNHDLWKQRVVTPNLIKVPSTPSAAPSKAPP